MSKYFIPILFLIIFLTAIIKKVKQKLQLVELSKTFSVENSVEKVENPLKIRVFPHCIIVETL